MFLLHLLSQDWLNTRKEGEKSLNDMQGYVNLPGQAVVESLYVWGFKDKNAKAESW